MDNGYQEEQENTKIYTGFRFIFWKYLTFLNSSPYMAAELCKQTAIKLGFRVAVQVQMLKDFRGLSEISTATWQTGC